MKKLFAACVLFPLCLLFWIIGWKPGQIVVQDWIDNLSR